MAWLLRIYTLALLVLCGSKISLSFSASEGNGYIAVCVSGHVRSLIQKNVYLSLKRNLIDPISTSHDSAITRNNKKQSHSHNNENENVDVFLYVELDENQSSGEAAVELTRINSGWDTGPSNFKTSYDELEPALQVIKPVELRFHNSALFANKVKDAVQGVANHTCEYPPKQVGPQLLKMNKCFQMVVSHEKLRGGKYLWVIRSRPDLGWIFPMPSISSFDASHVYVTSKYWPMGDQFALLPRQYASVYFNAINSWSLCIEPNSETQLRWLRDGVGAPEQLIWKHLHDYGVSLRYYAFPYVIVRPQPMGGVCKSLWNHGSELCLSLHNVNRSPFQYIPKEELLRNNREDQDGLIISTSDVSACTYTFFKATELLCEHMFPTSPIMNMQTASGDGKKSEKSYAIRVLKTLEKVNYINHQLKANPDVQHLVSPFPSTDHPLIITSTGGEQQNGQVATALLLSPQNVLDIDQSFECVLLEYEYLVSQIVYPSRSKEDGSNDDQKDASSMPSFDRRRCKLPWEKSSIQVEKDVQSRSENDEENEEENHVKVSYFMHQGEMALVASTLLQVTCLGVQCAEEGEDYDMLVNALKHEIKKRQR